MKQWLLAAALALAGVAGAAPPEWVSAEVTKVEPQRSQVLLKHEEIKSIGMGAMTMPFKTGKSVDLRRFKPGDKVRFTVVNQDDHLVVDAIEKIR